MHLVQPSSAQPYEMQKSAVCVYLQDRPVCLTALPRAFQNLPFWLTACKVSLLQAYLKFISCSPGHNSKFSLARLLVKNTGMLHLPGTFCQIHTGTRQHGASNVDKVFCRPCFAVSIMNSHASKQLKNALAGFLPQLKRWVYGLSPAELLF